MAKINMEKRDICETPVTETPQQKISKTLILPNSLERLNVSFGGNDVYFGGNNVYFWVFSKILGFWEFLFLLLGGFWDSVGRGDP